MHSAPDHYEQLRRELRQKRKELHLTQEALAEILGTSPTHMSRIERGQAVPGRDLLIRWCKTLDVSLDHTLLPETSGLDPRVLRLFQDVQRLEQSKQDRICHRRAPVLYCVLSYQKRDS